MSTELIQRNNEKVVINCPKDLSITDYCLTSVKNNEESLVKLFPSKKRNNCIKFDSNNLEEIYNCIEQNYNFKSIQAIIRKNAVALPLMYIAIDRADKSALNDKNFKDNVTAFFDLESGKYKSLLKSSNFDKIIDEYYNPRGKKLSDKDFENCLTLFCNNGYSESKSIVKSLFDKDFSFYTSCIEQKNNEITDCENYKKQMLDIILDECETDEIKKRLSSAFENTNKKFLDALKDITGKNQLNDYKKFCKVYVKQINAIDVKNREIANFQKIKKDARDLFKKHESLYFKYFNNVINNQIFSDDYFNIDEIQQTFIQMCQNLWNVIGKYGKDEEEIYEHIKNSLDNVIPSLLDFAKSSVFDSDKTYRSYCKLNSLYQSFYKFTSDENIKIKIVTDYKDSTFAPIPFEIIEDGLDVNKFNNNKTDRKIFIKCVEKLYIKLKRIEKSNPKIDNEFLTDRLKHINTKATYDMTLPEDVREAAFRWYFDLELDTSEEKYVSEKKEFCWKIIEALDRIDPSKLKPCDNRTYYLCRDFLIKYETNPEIENYLNSFINSSASKGLIVDFVVGYAKYNETFSNEKTEYKYKLKAQDIDIDFDVDISSEWKNRNK